MIADPDLISCDYDRSLIWENFNTDALIIYLGKFRLSKRSLKGKIPTVCSQIMELNSFLYFELIFPSKRQLKAGRPP